MSTEVEKVVANPLMNLLGRYKRQIEDILPKQMTPQRVLKLIVGAINRNPKLMQCTPMSVVNAVLTAATQGLEIRPGMAYLVPFRNKRGGTECTLIVDYRGKIDLAIRSGKVLDVDAEVVYSKEKFRLYRDEQGNKCIEHEPILYIQTETGEHRPLAKEEERGVPIGAYAIATLKEGRPKVAFMNALEITKIRSRSRASDDGPWVTDTMEMWKKTVVHRICKTLPQTPELSAAQELTEREESEVSLDGILTIEPGAQADTDDMPLVTESRAAAEAVADKKIRDLEGQPVSEQPTPKPTPLPIPQQPVEFATWEAHKAAGEPIHPLITITGGPDAGMFSYDKDTGWRPVVQQQPMQTEQPKRDRPVFGKKGQ